MNPELSRRAEDIFFDLLSVEEAGRQRALDDACGPDAELRAQVRSLLDNHQRAQGFLDTGRVRSGILGETPTLPAGTRIAGYTVLGVLGSGGMGVVYVAEQHRPRRTVALKLIRSGGGSLARRFELEAEVLGRLQHPGIAHIFEAGAAEVEGSAPLPFIAMELINGAPLTRYAEARALGVRERVDLLRRVCDAVEHAHQRGVIHRDLKPANILVGQDGRPKVLDFGVARAINEEAQGVTAHTDIGQMIGTLAYMSPEQVRADPAEVDTRSDVFALGVVLFELLTGRVPHELKSLPLPEAARVICETPAPRLSTISRSLRGDLETITAKALDKDKERRYRSAADLGDDLRRFLDGQPISARDDSALYVLRKQIRRYRGTVAVGAGSVIALAVTAIYALEQSAKNARLAQSESQAKIQAMEALGRAGHDRERASQAADKLRAELAVSNIERGRLFGRTANLAGAEDLIWPEYLLDPASRQTHWALWDLYSRQTCLGTMLAHRGPVLGVTLGPDDRMYSGGSDGEINVWDARTMRRLTTLRGHAEEVNDVALSRDGSRLASASGDGTVRIWNLDSAAPPLVILHSREHLPPDGIGPVRPVGARAAAFSPDGSRIATGGDDRTVRVWDTRTGRLISEMGERFNSGVAHVAWSPDGTLIAAAPRWPDGTIRLWDGVEGSPAAMLPGHQPTTSSIAFSPDSRTLASGGVDREIVLWDTATHAPRRKLSAPNGTVRCLQYSSDGRTLMSMGWWTLDLWDPDSGERRRSLSLREGANTGAMRADSQLVVAGFADGTVQMWDLTPDAGLIRIGGHSGRTTATMSPDARILATGDNAGRLRFFDTRDGRPLAERDAHLGRVRALKFTSDGRYLASTAEDERVCIWDLTTGARVAETAGIDALTCDSIVVAPDGQSLAAAATDESVRIMHLPDLRDIRRVPIHSGQIVSLRYSTAGDRFAVSGRDLKVRLFSAEGTLESQLSPPGPPWTTAFSQNDRAMALGSWNKTIELWDLTTNSMTATLRGHTALISALEYLPGHPSVLVSAAADGTVRLWDTQRGLALATLDAFGGWDALSLSLSSDGRRLASSSARGEVAIWDLAYFDRHIAGNTEYQIRLLLPTLGDAAKVDQARAWAADVLAKAHERWSPPSGRPGVAPETVVGWAAER